MTSADYSPATFPAAPASRDALATKKMMLVSLYASISALYLITLFMTCRRTSELVAVLLVLGVVNVTYAGVMWGAARRAVDVGVVRENPADFAFYAGASVFNALFSLQLLHVVTLPTYVAVHNAGPFVAHAATEALRRVSLMRDAFKPEQRHAALAYVAGLVVYSLPAAVTAAVGDRVVVYDKAPYTTKLGWSLLSLAAATVRHVTAARLPQGVTHDTMHAVENSGAWLFTMAYILTFKAFDETVSVDVNRAANFLTLSALLSLGVDACAGAAHAYNRELSASETLGAASRGPPIAFHAVTLLTRALVLVFSFVTMVPFDGYVVCFMVGHAFMLYAVHDFMSRQRDDRVVIDLNDFGSYKAPSELAGSQPRSRLASHSGVDEVSETASCAADECESKPV